MKITLFLNLLEN